MQSMACNWHTLLLLHVLHLNRISTYRKLLAQINKLLGQGFGLPAGTKPQLSDTTLAGVPFRFVAYSPVSDSQILFECTYAGTVYTHSSRVSGIPTLRCSPPAGMPCTSAALCSRCKHAQSSCSCFVP